MAWSTLQFGPLHHHHRDPGQVHHFFFLREWWHFLVFCIIVCFSANFQKVIWFLYHQVVEGTDCFSGAKAFSLKEWLFLVSAFVGHIDVICASASQVPFRWGFHVDLNDVSRCFILLTSRRRLKMTGQKRSFSRKSDTGKPCLLFGWNCRRMIHIIYACLTACPAFQSRFWTQLPMFRPRNSHPARDHHLMSHPRKRNEDCWW